jgi:sugar phosphate isomerase/epimerase
MNFSGIADEAGKDLATQIRAHKTLGWNYIEVRNVDGTQFTDVSDEKFDQVCSQLAEAGMGVSAFASGIANWATKITDPFEQSTSTLQRAIGRMQKLNSKFIRVMSYPNDGLADDQWRDEAVRRFKELGKMAEDGGIILMVENCDGYASASAQNYGRFFEMVNSPAVKAVYDTGNPASHGESNTWEWYQAARPHIAYIHIKAQTEAQNGEKGSHVFPDSGASKVEETLRDVFTTGYDGFISIEPHMQAVVHEGKEISNEEAAFNTYVEYGQRLMKLVEKVKAG